MLGHVVSEQPGRARDLVKLSREVEKPLPHLWLAGDLGKEGLDILREEGVPVAENTDSLLRAVGGLIRLGKLQRGENQAEYARPDLPLLEQMKTFQDSE